MIIEKSLPTIKSNLRLIIFFCLFLYFLPFQDHSFSQDSTEQINLIELLIDEPRIIEIDGLKKFLILDPQIAIGRIILPDKLEITGKTKGQTFIHIWYNQALRSIKVKVEERQIKILQEKIRREEVEVKKIPALKLDYFFDYRTQRKGFEVWRVKQQERIDTHRLILNGPTPYGKVDSLFWFERRSIPALDKKEVLLDERNITLKLLDGKINQLQGFDFILGDNWLNLSQLTFPGYRFRGITYRTHGHLAIEKSIRPFGYTFFWGRSKLGSTIGMPAGLDKKLDSFYIGSRLDYQTNENLKVFTTVVSRYGDYKLECSDNSVSIGTLMNYELFDFEAEVAQANRSYGYKLKSSLNLFKKFGFTTEFRDIQPHFLTIGGRPPEQGIRGARISSTFSPFKSFVLSTDIDYYKDRILLSPQDPKRYNLVYAIASQLNLPKDISLIAIYRNIDQRGTLFPYQGESLSMRISKTFLFGQKFFIRSLSSFYLGEVYQTKDLNLPTNDYQNKKQEFGISMGLPLGFFINSSYQYNILKETYYNVVSNPRQWQSSINFSSQIFNSLSFNLFTSYSKVGDTQSPLCFIPRQDVIQGEASLNLRVSPESNFYLRLNIAEYRPTDSMAKNYNEMRFYIGGYFKFDTGIGIAPKGNIKGRVFRDLNKNGFWEINEPGIAKVRLIIGKKIATTDIEGRYSFIGVRGREVVLKVDGQSLPSGFIYTTPSARKILIEHTKTLEVNFGLASKIEIKGLVFCDVNENGIFDIPDFVLENIVLMLYSGESTTSLRDGTYLLENLRSGPNELSLVLLSTPVGYIPIYPAKIKLELKEGETKRIDFPLKAQRTAMGYVFIDSNQDGIFQKGEKAIPGIKVYLDSLSTLTDKDGCYIFTGLKMGKYNITVDKTALPKEFILIKDSLFIELGGEPTSKINLNFPLTKK